MIKYTEYKYHAAALFTVAVWGATFVSTKVLIAHSLTPAEIFLLRFALAYVCIWPLSKGRLRADGWRDEALLAAAGVTGGSFYFLTENSALGLTLASNVALLVATAPILTVILTRLLLKSGGLRNSLIAGSFIALLGVACVVYNGSVILQVHPLGDLLSFTAALTWAFYNIFLKKLDGKYNTLYITRKVFFYGVLTLLPVFLIRPLTTDTAILLRPMVFSNLLFLGLIASLFCFAVWNAAVKHLGTLATSNYIYLVPLVTMISSALLLHERITPVALTGAMMILGGVYVAENGGSIPSVKRLFVKHT